MKGPIRPCACVADPRRQIFDLGEGYPGHLEVPRGFGVASSPSSPSCCATSRSRIAVSRRTFSAGRGTGFCRDLATGAIGGLEMHPVDRPPWLPQQRTTGTVAALLFDLPPSPHAKPSRPALRVQVVRPVGRSTRTRRGRPLPGRITGNVLRGSTGQPAAASSRSLVSTPARAPRLYCSSADVGDDHTGGPQRYLGHDLAPWVDDARRADAEIVLIPFAGDVR